MAPVLHPEAVPNFEGERQSTGTRQEGTVVSTC